MAINETEKCKQKVETGTATEFIWELGIDEAGRGPLAGPVAVGLVLVPTNFDWSLIAGVGDSKQLSEKRREAVRVCATNLAEKGQLFISVQQSSAGDIDKLGIVPALNQAILVGLQDLENQLSQLGMGLDWPQVMVKLDGALRAPSFCVHQETIIKGDALEPTIGLASIIAKVTRDHYMTLLGQQAAYQVYNFPQHKGYGTKNHQELILRHGLSSEHRVSYCQNIINGLL